MLSDPYEFIWRPQRPARSKEQVEADIEKFKDVKLEHIFTFEDRLAVRELIYIVINDENFRNIFDGLFLPPPYILPSLADKRWTGEDVACLVGRFDPSLDGVVVRLPFNLAVQLGNYSARLHAASQRLCWILNVPLAIVEAQEKMSLRFYEEYVRSSDVNPHTPVQEDIEGRRAQRKWNLKRTATIAGFSTLGGAALLVTGGVAAPMVASAYAALSTGLTTTICAIGSLGGAVLGTGALASVFAAVVGVSTHAAALTTLLTPALTVGHIASIFGVTGAALSGYKAYRRTNDSGVFLIRSVDEVEGLPEGPEVPTPPVATPRTPFAQPPATEPPDRMETGRLAAELRGDVDATTRAGLVAPLHTFLATVANTRRLSCLRRCTRQVVFGVLVRLPGRALRLRAWRLTTGVWALLPPRTIACGEVGVLACRNRRMFPTGAGFILGYDVVQVGAAAVTREGVGTPNPSEGTPGGGRGGGKERATQRVWVRVHCDLFGVWELSCFVEGAEGGFDPLRAETRLESAVESQDFSEAQGGMTMTMRHQPVTYLKLTPFSGTEGRTTETFPVKELAQHMSERDCDITRRRKVGVAIVNQSTHTVCVREVSLLNGISCQRSALPQMVESRTALLEFYANQDWDLRGAEGFYILELRNTNDNPLVDVYFVRLEFEISALNNLGIAVAVAPTLRELKMMPLKTQSPESSEFEVSLSDGLFFSLNARIVEKFKTIQLRVLDFVERHIDKQAVQTQAKLTVGVCGYTSIFDPRRPPQDQQVGLWKCALKDLALVGASETYAVQWEDEYLDLFGKSVDIEFSITDQVSRKAFGKAKALLKKQLMQSAIFSGFRAFKSLMGSMYIPMYAIRAFGAIDNAFATLSNRAVFTGLDLAKALLDTRIGHRPVTLIGFSFGCKVVCECLLELHRVKAFNLIDNVFLMGSTVPADTDVWMRMREVVAGRLVNLYTRRDLVLWLMYSVNETDLRPMAGISSINLPGIENIDVTPIVERHYDYGFKLRDVLNLIPLQPTEETWSKRDLRGSPGIIVPSRECGRTMKNMGKSLSLILSSTPFCVFSLLNSLVSDKAGFEISLELLSFSALNGFFDFRPPQFVPPLSAGVFGAVGESGVEPIGGAVSFIARLDKFSEFDILLIIFFYAEKKRNVSVAVYPSLVKRRDSEQESSEEAKKRLCTIASQAFEDLEGVRKICESKAAMRAGMNQTISQSFKVPTHCLFTDGHDQATVFVDLVRVSNGISISVRALLTKLSSQPQQEHFTEEVFDSLYDNQDTILEGGETSGVAEVYPIDEFHNELITFAGKLNRDRTKDEPKTMKGDDMVELQEAESTAVASNIIRVVIANCNEVPLYFIEPETSSEDDSKISDGDPSDTSEVISLDMLSSPWLRAPPSKLPPRSFCVVIFRDSVGQPPLSLRYTTAHGSCGFTIYAPTTGRASGDVEKDSQLVKCDRLSSHNGKDAISTSTTRIGGTLFQQVFLVVKMAEEASTTTSPGNTSMSKQLKSHGWVIV